MKEMHDKRHKADWLSFIMHFIVGLIAGCLLGMFVIHKRRHGIWLEREQIMPFLTGTSLAMGGFGARWGDRLWLGLSYRVIPPDQPTHSKASLTVSSISMVVGIALAVAALVRHFS